MRSLAIDRSVFLIALGQSAHVLSPHYVDLRPGGAWPCPRVGSPSTHTARSCQDWLSLGQRTLLCWGNDLGRLRPSRWVALVFEFVGFLTEFFRQSAEFVLGPPVEAIACRHQATDGQAPKVGRRQRIHPKESPRLADLRMIRCGEAAVISNTFCRNDAVPLALAPCRYVANLASHPQLNEPVLGCWSERDDRCNCQVDRSRN